MNSEVVKVKRNRQSEISELAKSEFINATERDDSILSEQQHSHLNQIIIIADTFTQKFIIHQRERSSLIIII